MKISLLIVSLVGTALAFEARAQSTFSGGAGGHFGTNATFDYLGWDNNTGIDLQIRHDRGRPITFHTGNNFGSPAPEHMRLTSQGRLGIGLRMPQRLQHLHTQDVENDVFTQWTTLLTHNGITLEPQATDGLIIGVRPVGPNVFSLVPFAEINQQEDAPIVFSTDKTERMRIMGTTNLNGASNLNAGFVGIGGVDNPRSMLHLGRSTNSVAGWRPWMEYGAYYNFESENMFTGLKGGAPTSASL